MIEYGTYYARLDILDKTELIHVIHVCILHAMLLRHVFDTSNTFPDFAEVIFQLDVLKLIDGSELRDFHVST